MVEITQRNFERFIKSQHALVEALNHKMTKMESDVSWMKKIQNWQTGLFTATFLTVLGIAIKLIA